MPCHCLARELCHKQLRLGCFSGKLISWQLRYFDYFEVRLLCWTTGVGTNFCKTKVAPIFDKILYFVFNAIHISIITAVECTREKHCCTKFHRPLFEEFDSLCTCTNKYVKFLHHTWFSDRLKFQITRLEV